MVPYKTNKGLKTRFHMIADDRRSHDRRDDCSHNISFSGNVKYTHALCLLQANLFLLLVLKRRQRQLQNRRKHRFWIRKIFMKRRDNLNFSPIFSQLLAFLFLSLEFLLLRLQTQSYRAASSINSSLVTLPCSVPAMFKANKRCYKRTFGLCGLEALNHRSELKILWDTFRSQNFGFHMIAGLQTITDNRRRSRKCVSI